MNWVIRCYFRSPFPPCITSMYCARALFCGIWIFSDAAFCVCLDPAWPYWWAGGLQVKPSPAYSTLQHPLSQHSCPLWVEHYQEVIDTAEMCLFFHQSPSLLTSTSPVRQKDWAFCLQTKLVCVLNVVWLDWWKYSQGVCLKLWKAIYRALVKDWSLCQNMW